MDLVNYYRCFFMILSFFWIKCICCCCFREELCYVWVYSMCGGYGMWIFKEACECRVNVYVFKFGDFSLDVLFLNVCVGEFCVWNEVGDSCWFIEFMFFFLSLFMLRISYFGEEIFC